MRALWLAAPLALLRHAAVFAAVAVAVALAASAASSTPFIRAGVKSAALRAQVKSISALGAGFELNTGGSLGTDVARRSAAAAFGRAHRLPEPPVVASMFPANTVEGNFDVVVMARTAASAHVTHVSGHGDDGVWISEALAKTTGLGTGDILPLTEDPRFTTLPGRTRLRISGVYAALDGDFENPYWSNWVQLIRARNPDAPLPPTFVLVPEQTLLRVARALKQTSVQNTFEFPIDPSNLTYVGAEQLSRTYAQIGNSITSSDGLNCGIGTRSPCRTGSSLSAALGVAEQQVTEVSTTISLLSACGLAIAALIAAAAGVFLVRRRVDEVQLLFARGEAPGSFALRTAVEALLPACIGLAAGFGVAVAALALFAPAGTLDHGTLVAGALDATAAAAVAVVLLALAALTSFPRLPHHAGLARKLLAIPWEVVPLAAVGVLLGLLFSGSALTHDAQGHGHPRLVVFLLPAVAAAGLAGLVARAARRLAARRGTSAPLSLFLVLRRVAAARGIIVAVAVSAATAFGVYAYAQTLSSSLTRTAAEKAFVGNGSDVQGLIDPTERIYKPFPFPATTAQVDSTNIVLRSGQGVVLIAGNPAELAKVLEWGNWPDDPRLQLPKLAHATAPAGVLPVIASRDFPNVSALDDQGVSIPIRVVARAPVPGSLGGWPAVLVDATRLHAVARFHHVKDPGDQAGAVIWARGDPHVIEPALTRSSLRPSYLTTLSFIHSDPSVVASARSYRYLRAIGIACVLLAVTSLLLYLQTRQRGQRLASALLRRMGVQASVDVLTLALEAAAIAVGACLVGGAVGIGAARLVVPHVDPLPQYAPTTVLVYPWAMLVLVALAITVAAGAFAAGAVVLALRTNVAEELRVA